MKKRSYVVILVVVSVLFLGSPGNAREESGRWTFVVFGDTRDIDQDTRTGISPYLSTIAQGIAAEKPDLVIHTGDLTNGYYTHGHSPVHGKFQEMFANWKVAMKPVYDYSQGKGIPIYVVRGNHEDGEIITNSHLKKAYLDAFGHLMPQNGPAEEKGLTFSFTHRQAKFIGTDQYRGFEILEKGRLNQAWLNEQLTREPKPFIFVFGHTPAYKVAVKGTHASPPPLLYEHTADRDLFWKSLKDAGVPLYLCGHVHFYCRGSKDGIEQVLVGNGGANMVDFDPTQIDPALTLRYPKEPVKSGEMKVGYMVITVDEKTATLEAVLKLRDVQAKRWDAGDPFTMSLRRLRP